ncbi:MAG: C-GCAxxG-C-C family protein [Defluviitaleaceae bacterium]|nr:C-GCAxxG-C-C family protein [Defluviitaleaceae bacterium]
MDKLALKYHNLEYNCSLCILKAFEEKHSVPLTHQLEESCKVMSSGFGIGVICNALTAGVMIFGIMHDETLAKSARIALLSDTQEKYGSINCAPLKDVYECEDIIAYIANKIDELITN